MADITFETKKDFGNFGGNKKLTFTAWNGNSPRYDIRDWYDGKAGKGITLDKTELKALYDILQKMYEETTNTEVAEVITETEEPSMLDISTDTTTESKYPQAIQNIFDSLDDLFKGFSIHKNYGTMPFAEGERVQYFVRKDENKPFPDYEALITQLQVKSFITNNGNLYIYTL